MSVINLDTVTAKYIETRDEISKLNKQIDELKALQGKREEWMLGELNKLQLQNVKTPHGVTVYQTLKESVSVADWDSVLNHVLWEGIRKAMIHSGIWYDDETPDEDRHAINDIINEAKRFCKTEYLTKGVNKTAVLECMGDKRENTAPPGVNYVAVRTVGIRKG